MTRATDAPSDDAAVDAPATQREGEPLLRAQGVWKVFGPHADRVVGTPDAELSRSELRAKTGATASSDTSGLDASVIPWLKRRDVAVIASEFALDARPSSDGLGLAVHDFALAYLGIHVIDNCDLTALAEAAGARKRWAFQFIAAPLPIRTGTGSPINPIAVF